MDRKKRIRSKLLERLIEAANYDETPDEELVELAKSGNDVAEEVLIRRYERLIWKISENYFSPGYDREDIVQEALIGFIGAIDTYDPEKGNKFINTAILAAKRAIYKIIQASDTDKRKVMNDYEDLENVIQYSLKGTPADIYEEKEALSELVAYISEEFTKLEKDVFIYRIKGYKYDEMIDKIGKPYKSLENAMGRIKGKLKDYKEGR